MRITDGFTAGHKGRRLWPILLCCVILLTGCGRAGEQAAPTMVVVTPAPTAASAGSSGQMVTALSEQPGTSHPLLSVNREMRSLLGLVFEPLVKLDASGAPQPCLAESWVQDETGKVWTFTLRTGVTWQGTGRALEADDVIATLDLIREIGSEPLPQSQSNNIYETPLYTVTPPYGTVLSYVESWEKVDDRTVRLTFSHAFYGTLHALNFPILPKDGGYTATSAPAKPQGTGAYAVTLFENGNHMVLEVWEGWWKKAPSIAKVEAKPYRDMETALSSLMLRQLDMAQTDDVTINQYRDSGDLMTYEYATRYFEYMGFNFGTGVLQNKAVRQAIAYGINRRSIADNVYVNHAILVDSPIMPTSWLYDGKRITYSNDIERAKALLGEAGLTDSDGDGLVDQGGSAITLKLLTHNDKEHGQRQEAARLIASQLEGIGLKVEVTALPWNEYCLAMERKEFDLVLTGCYMGEVPDFTALLGTGGALNVGGYSSSTMDTLLSQMLECPESISLQNKAEEIKTITVEELPILSLYCRTHTLATGQQVLGVTGVDEEDVFAQIESWYLDMSRLN